MLKDRLKEANGTEALDELELMQASREAEAMELHRKTVGAVRALALDRVGILRPSQRHAKIDEIAAEQPHDDQYRIPQSPETLH